MSEVQQTLACIELTATRFGMAGKAAQATTSGALQIAAPPGGTGATAGAYDSAVHRDTAINLLNEIRTTLINNGIMKGSA